MLSTDRPVGHNPHLKKYYSKWCQSMVIGTNTMPTGIPSLGSCEKGNFIQCE